MRMVFCFNRLAQGFHQEYRSAGALPQAEQTRGPATAQKLHDEETTHKLCRGNKGEKDPLTEGNALEASLETNNTEEFCKFEIGRADLQDVTTTKKRGSIARGTVWQHALKVNLNTTKIEEFYREHGPGKWQDPDNTQRRHRHDDHDHDYHEHLPQNNNMLTRKTDR